MSHHMGSQQVFVWPSSTAGASVSEAGEEIWRDLRIVQIVRWIASDQDVVAPQGKQIKVDKDKDKYKDKYKYEHVAPKGKEKQEF